MKNTLYTGDNLHFLYRMDSESVDLIYLDPPFNSKRMYSAPIGSKAAGNSFKDMWTWDDVDEGLLETLFIKQPAFVSFIKSIGEIHSTPMMAYVTYMAQRMIEMHRILKDTGSVYLHCDPTASHYLKIVLDEIFGHKNFQNEVLWCYSTSGRSTRGKRNKWAKKHDILLWYAKDVDKFEADCTLPVSEKYIRSHYKQKDKDGRPCRIRVDAGKERIYYPDEGINGNDWWADIPYENSQARSRTGYPTQKPLPLLRRIVETSTNEGELVLDPFCGCATTCVAAQQLGRKWIGIDIEENASDLLVERLSGDAGIFKDFLHTHNLPERSDLAIEEPTKTVKAELYRAQNGRCNGCGVNFDEWNLEIDHIIPSSKGGSDTKSNYQLLCGSCNRIKGDRPMEYLRNKIKLRDEVLAMQITFGK